MGAIFDPGDQKVIGEAIIETPDSTHVRPSPHAIRRIWIDLVLFFTLMGILCSLLVELISGLFATVFAAFIAAMLMKREAAEWMMVRRMRKRAEQSSHAHKVA